MKNAISMAFIRDMMPSFHSRFFMSCFRHSMEQKSFVDDETFADSGNSFLQSGLAHVNILSKPEKSSDLSWSSHFNILHLLFVLCSPPIEV